MKKRFLTVTLVVFSSHIFANATVVETALTWQGKGYKVGKTEQCMNWTREVLISACGEHFKTLQTTQPWDIHLLGVDDKLAVIHADSLASDEFGKRITRLSDVLEGDLIFLKNTYGNWAEGVITHVGIALDNTQYIHRMTSNKGVVKVEAIPSHQFAGALRLARKFCQPKQ
ncbi:NlpC/P60 family protein [Pseudoalteromonas sp. PA2MD11]|uniref:NlpC/P60 family protein n=1 Tax=Pseudoalteromonas sp. PA2MD11 TaxID=2785057 RepID=UPI001AE04877|nr:NlpC/P60 family protein [Pseudoalteromonas sp. PA2MD11]